WDFRDRWAARRAWLRWYERAIRSRLEPVKKAARLVTERLNGILNAAITGMTNAKVEGINSAVQWVKATTCQCQNHLLDQARSYIMTGTYHGANPLEVGPYSTAPGHWP